MLKKLGTIDIFIVEANPLVFKGRPWLMQYIRYTKSNPWPLLLYGFPGTEMHEYSTFLPLVLD